MKHGTPREQQAKASRQSGGSRVFFKKPVNGQLAADGLTRICPPFQRGANTFDIVAIKRGQKFIVDAGHLDAPAHKPQPT
jgi:hypothetical protein